MSLNWIDMKLEQSVILVGSGGGGGGGYPKRRPMKIVRDVEGWNERGTERAREGRYNQSWDRNPTDCFLILTPISNHSALQSTSL